MKVFFEISSDNSYFKKKEAFCFSSFLLGIINWTLLGCSTLLISQSLGLDLSVIQASSATFIGYLFGMIPMSPGGIGTYEGAMTLQLYNSNVSQDSALSLSILSRVFTFWIAILISFLSITLIKITHKFQWFTFLSYSRRSNFNQDLASPQNKIR
ncbi:lysylphosphatidylglycerol synthase transmembrane domain-containing protein [Natranaerobius trueperi]|uniref:Phosphatidylglycerol lysyltransferase n=1 Tax=Natranaerobius trueperi TaxID=759412 RepID=A0A226C0I4_9FIRM|nr:hypothetical protein CDO51_01975 [Natranaerobius trueperi]